MIIEIILFVLGIISFYLSYLNLKKLSNEKIYNNDTTPIKTLYSLNFLKMIIGLFYPWTLFKPLKVKEGWFLLLKSLIFIVLGIYLIYFSFIPF